MKNKIIQKYLCDAGSALLSIDGVLINIPNGCGDCFGDIYLIDYQTFYDEEKKFKRQNCNVEHSWIITRCKKELRVYNYDCYRREEDLQNKDNYISIVGEKSYMFGYCDNDIYIIED